MVFVTFDTQINLILVVNLSLRKIVFLTSVLMSLIAGAQSFQFSNYSLKEGLPQSQVYCLLEDDNGYIWMGTRGGGVTRFNGIDFETYTTKENLAGNYINAIASDRSVIWVATNSGVSYYKNKRWITPTSFAGRIIQDIKYIDGTIWLITGGSLYKCNLTLDEFEKVKSAPRGLKQIERGAENELWVSSSSNVYSLKQDSVSTFSLNKAIEAIVYGKDKSVWVGTHGQGLYKLVKGQWIEYGHLMGIDEEIVYDVYQEENSIWVSTLQNGLFKFNTTDSSYINFKEVNGLANNHVRVTVKDNWNNMWIGTGGGGVSKYSGQTFEKWSKNNGLRGNYIYSILEDKNGSSWIGTSGGGVTVIDSSIHYLNGSNGFSNKKVKALFQAKDSAVWLGTDGDGLAVVLSDTLLKFNSLNGLKSNWVKSFAEDSKGHVWVASSGGGISQFIKSQDSTFYSIENYTVSQRQLISDHIIDIEVDWKDRVWYAVPGKGLGFIDGNTFSRSTVKGLNRENLRSLAIDSNYLYVASTKGINVVDLHSDSIYARVLENPYQLSSENIYALQLDAEGNLWIGTEKGLDRLKLDGKKVLELEHFDASNGFTGVETTTNASTLDAEGNVWFGSIDGLFKYNKHDQSKNTVAPKLSWKEIKIGRKTTTEILEGHSRIDEWVLPYGNNRISFDFIAINHSAPTKVRYKWKLQGRDNTFSEPTQNHFIEYGSLPPGSYTFQAYAENENGVWSERPLSFTFRVVTPLWQEPWFIVLTGLWLAGMVYALYGWRIRLTRKKSAEREEKLELEKTLVQLEQKALQLQMNPHFIFHTLNSIQELIATKEEKIARRYLTQFSKLMRQILDGSRTNTTSLASEVKMLTNYLALEKFSHEDRFDFEISCESDELEFISIPSMIIQPFVENALIHGALKANEAGKVLLEFQVFEKEVKCIILDNGPGLGESTSDHKSSAIEITKERLTMLSGKENSIVIQNRKEKGVEAILHLPIIEENETV